MLLPQAELVYMTERRANARLLIDHGVPVAIATDYCSSIHATSLTTTLGAGRAVVSDDRRRGDRRRDAERRLRPARSQADRGSLEVGKRGDLTVLDVEHPNELYLAVGQSVVSDVVIGGEIVHSSAATHHDSEEPMSHTRIRPFNTRDTYPEQDLDNDLCQAVVAGNMVFLRGQVGQDLDTDGVGRDRRRRGPGRAGDGQHRACC